MSHRKFECPRHGNLGFLPKKRTKHVDGKIKSFPKDDASKPPHLTAFMTFKAGCTHVLRTVNKPGSKLDKKDVVEPVTLLECPAMKVVGMVGYVDTPRGKRVLSSVFAGHLDESFKRRLYKNWYKVKKKAYTKYAKEFEKDGMQARLDRISKYCTTVRAVVHTQVGKMGPNSLGGQKRAHVKEVQVNGGNSASDKVAFIKALFEKDVRVGDLFSKNEMVDLISVTKGRGIDGVVTRWGVTRLPRKTHRGLRKVACIGSWHPAKVQFHVPRAGQNGFHHRVEINKKIYRIGKHDENPGNDAGTDFDLTQKSVTALGGFCHYGAVGNGAEFGKKETDWVMVKGGVAGTKKRLVTIRQSLKPPATRAALEEVELKFIDTSSKRGHGRFQTAEEKRKFFGRK